MWSKKIFSTEENKKFATLNVLFDWKLTLTSLLSLSRDLATLTRPWNFQVDLEVKVTQSGFCFVGTGRMRCERALEERLDTKVEELGSKLSRARHQVANRHARLPLKDTTTFTLHVPKNALRYDITLLQGRGSEGLDAVPEHRRGSDVEQEP